MIFLAAKRSGKDVHNQQHQPWIRLDNLGRSGSLSTSAFPENTTFHGSSIATSTLIPQSVSRFLTEVTYAFSPLSAVPIKTITYK